VTQRNNYSPVEGAETHCDREAASLCFEIEKREKEAHILLPEADRVAESEKAPKSPKSA